MPIPASKEQVLVKMQELDVALQTAIKIRSELWSMIANLPADTRFAGLEIPLTFYESGNVIVWGNQNKSFTPPTFRLLLELWCAPDRTLSKETIRHVVKDDGEATDIALWTHISRAREEIQSVDFPYFIETLRNEGYRLAKR